MKILKKFSTVFCLLFLCMACLAMGGCQIYTGVEGAPDVNINMTPRKISTENANTFEQIVETVIPAVVGISAVYGDVESVGSGVAVANGGYVLTNNHVVADANSITVYYANKTSGRASLIWSDPAMDLAVVKTSVNIPYLTTGDSTSLKVGENIIAIGTPLTLQFKHTVTHGIISALDRTIEIDNEDNTTSYLQNLIQHDSSINPGNSGGPLIDDNGNVIGINTLKVSEAEGIGFAIPIEVAIPVVNQILKNGTYETPYLGMFGFDSEIAAFYGRTLEKDGVYIVNIDSNGTIGKSGLQEGDIITKVGDAKIKTMLDLRTQLYYYNVGDSITITYLRDGGERIANLSLTSRP